MLVPHFSRWKVERLAGLKLFSNILTASLSRESLLQVHLTWVWGNDSTVWKCICAVDFRFWGQLCRYPHSVHLRAPGRVCFLFLDWSLCLLCLSSTTLGLIADFLFLKDIGMNFSTTLSTSFEDGLTLCMTQYYVGHIFAPIQDWVNPTYNVQALLTQASAPHLAISLLFNVMTLLLFWTSRSNVSCPLGI